LYVFGVAQLSSFSSWEMYFIITAPIAIWALFSRDRKGQAKLLLRIFRGY
jgi:hypothetical protein